MDFGCAAYCPYAVHCLGALPEGIATDERLKLLMGKMLREIKAEFHYDSRKVARSVNFLELCLDLGKREGAKLGPVLLAAFLIALSPEDVELSDVSKQRQGLEKQLKRLNTDQQIVEDALDLFKDYISQERKDTGEQNVIRDALLMSKSEMAGNNDWNSLEKRLLTKSAKQLALDRAASNPKF
jgi:hypothetical protein